MSKAIVTGGAGFIGSNLVSLLLDRGWEVLVIDDFSVGKKENLPKRSNLYIIEADIRNRTRMKKLIKDVDAVFHLAVQCVRKSIRDPYLVHEVNAGGTLNVLQSAYANQVRKFVYVSSSEVYGSALTVPMRETHPTQPTTVYGGSKLAGELYALAYLHTYGYPVVIVRPFNTYGYHEHFEGPYGEVIPRFVVRALNNLPLQIFGDGSQTRDFTFVTDTAEGILSVYEKGRVGEVYNIARGKEVSISDLAKIVLKVCGKKLPIQHLAPRPGDVMRHFADTRRAKKEFGFTAKTDIEEGVEKYLEWFKKKFPEPKEALKFYEEKNW